MNTEKIDRNVTLTITEACNLDCSYCYEDHKSKEVMSFETARAIIDKEFCEEKKYNEIALDFFGGEPFLYFDLIKQIDEYIKSLNYKGEYILFATTNGTLVHGEIQEWLLERKDYFICGLSYDGTPQMQDINRSNSSSKIDLDFFKKAYPGQGIKMTISKDTLPTLSDGVIYLQEKGFEVFCNLAYGVDWSDEINKEILSNELMKLINYYLAHPEYPPCSILNTSISNIAISKEQKKFIRSCGAGVGTIAYHIDGTSYPCQFFMPLSVGKEKAKAALDIKFYDEEIPEELIEGKCVSCAAQSVCPTCFGANYAATGNMYTHDDNYCKLTKIIIQARSFFMAKKWELGQLTFENEDEEQLLLRSIQIIQNELN